MKVGLMRISRAVVLAAIVAGLLATGSLGASKTSTPKAGGVYRVAFEQAFGFSDGFDPTGEYYTYSFAIESNLMIRTLVGYDHVAGAAGNKLVPDIATTVPTPTDGGKTYTFHLKPGVKFGPPVGRAVTSKDVLYSFERIANPKDGSEYAFYYSAIAGFDAYRAGKAKTISGIQTPSSSTIVFHLTQPTGDFLYRLAMPATGPIPAEVADCFEGHPGRYGRDVVSTGPYMFEGADKANDSACSKLKPMSGFDPLASMTLVRNPDYDPKTDSPAARQNFPDEFAFTIDPNRTDVINRVAAGALDDENGASLPAQALQSYSTDPSKKQYLHLDPADGTQYLTMNLTQPPFDDIHVRRAMNWIIDREALRQAWGGPTVGKVANHIVPDSIFDNELADYNPYKTPGEHGSLAQAKAAMKGSKYDPDHTGTCNASACHDVLLLSDSQATFGKMLPIVQQDAAKIGITFHVAVVAGAYPTLQATAKNIPIAIFPGWFKDYADPLTFFKPLFDGRTIIGEGNVNYSLVGMEPSQAKALGVKGDTKNVPNVDAQLDRCAVLAGSARRSCYESLDRTLTTQVVPWVPFLWIYNQHITSSRVTQWDYDQFSGTTAYAHVAVS